MQTIRTFDMVYSMGLTSDRQCRLVFAVFFIATASASIHVRSITRLPTSLWVPKHLRKPSIQVHSVLENYLVLENKRLMRFHRYVSASTRTRAPS